ncbi:hypothetical protein [Nitrosomonas sp. JL21]|uniref:hypothetical protein n=1 Tax=Nitrosomonas sp. JL21 TaxID=153949 RepID=UPI0013696D08|nr:hypothetical protein [Nitrosomonas sp. JL21]
MRRSTLPEAIEQITILTDQKPEAVFVDKGYRVSALRGWRSGAVVRNAASYN